MREEEMADGALAAASNSRGQSSVALDVNIAFLAGHAPRKIRLP